MKTMPAHDLAEEKLFSEVILCYNGRQELSERSEEKRAFLIRCSMFMVHCH